MTSHSSHPDVPAHVHIVPMKILWTIFIWLLILTAVTVAVWKFNLGPLAIWVSLAVAVIKGGLVAMYFMHLRYDSLFNGTILLAALVFVGLFIGISLVDTSEYQPQIIPPSQILTPDAAATPAPPP